MVEFEREIAGGDIDWLGVTIPELDRE